MAEEHWAQRAQERVGRVLRQKWRLDRLLGVGGMAAVYASTHRNGKRAAVKVLHAEHGMNPELRSRFLREGYVANTVDHPGTVSVLDDDSDEDGCVYLVMELLEGETLEQRWERKGQKLDPGEVLSITDKLLDVMGAAHEKQIIHRDIKPENIFLTREGVVKVLDFGIARLLEISQASTRTTRAGAAMGTPAFMPPEQAAGDWDAVDERTDLWAVGAVMFTLISGRFVHEGRNLNEQLIASATKPAPSLAAVCASVEPPIVEFVDKALAFKKGDRWADARSMQFALREAYWAKDGEVGPRHRSGEHEAFPPVNEKISIHVPVANIAAIEDEILRQSGSSADNNAAINAASTAAKNAAKNAGSDAHGDEDSDDEATVFGSREDLRLRSASADDTQDTSAVDASAIDDIPDASPPSASDSEATVFQPRNVAMALAKEAGRVKGAAPAAAPAAPAGDGAEDDSPTQAGVDAFDATVPLTVKEARAWMDEKRRVSQAKVVVAPRAEKEPSGSNPRLSRPSGNHRNDAHRSGSHSARPGAPSGGQAAGRRVSGPPPAGSGSNPSYRRQAAGSGGRTLATTPEEDDAEAMGVFRVERPRPQDRASSPSLLELKQVKVMSNKAGRTMDGMSASPAARPSLFKVTGKTRVVGMAILGGLATGLLALFVAVVFRSATSAPAAARTAASGASHASDGGKP